MGNIMDRAQTQFKKSFLNFLIYVARIITGGWIGLVFAQVFRMIFSCSDFVFYFIIVLSTAILVRLTRFWRFFPVIILNLFFILVLSLLRLYIIVAPGT